MDGVELPTGQWRGRVGAEIETLKTNVNTLFRLCEVLTASVQALSLQVNTLATKIGMYAAIGGFIGGGLMALVVSYLTRKI